MIRLRIELVMSSGTDANVASIAQQLLRVGQQDREINIIENRVQITKTVRVATRLEIFV